LTGTWITGGTATTTKPHLLIEQSGTTSTGWNVYGTAFGINAPSGFAGKVLDVLSNGVSLAHIGSIGNIQGQYLTSTANIILTSNSGLLYFGTLNDVLVGRKAAANLRQGAADAAAPVAQTSSVQSVATGTSNTAGVTRTYSGSQGTGTGVGGAHVFQVAPAGAPGTAQNALVTAFTINGDGTSTFANNQYGQLGTAAGVVVSLPRSYASVYNG
jgi:hypothetical protein